MRKLGAILAGLCLLLALSMPALATEEPVTLLTPAAVAPNSEFTVQVSLAKREAVKSIAIVPEYDRSTFTLVSGRWEVDGAISDFSTTTGDGVLAFSQPSQVADAVLSFTLRVREDAPQGKQTLRCTVILTEGEDQRKELTASAEVTVSCPHDYDNACDTTCNLCSEVRQAVHLYENGICTLCGAEKATEPAPTAETPATGETTQQPAVTTTPDAGEETPESTDSDGLWVWILGGGLLLLLTGGFLWRYLRKRTGKEEKAK